MTYQQRQASDPFVSAWVSASAGTGKTHVLTNRVLSLMLAGARPQAILCLTFTKAAAAEMANRIYERLGKWSQMSDPELTRQVAALAGDCDSKTLAHARRLFAHVLDVPGGLKIQTIHSFCQSLLGRFPLEAGITPHFKAIDERTAAEYLREATEAVLDAARTNSGDDRLAHALSVISRHSDERDFLALLADILKERGKLERLSGIHGIDVAVAKLRQEFGLGLTDTEEAILAEACSDGFFDADRLRAAAGTLAGGGKTDQRRGQVVADWLASPGTRERDFQRYQAEFLTKKGVPKKTLITKAAAARNPDALVALTDEAERLQTVNHQRRLARVAEASAALMLLAVKISDAYQAIKDRHAALDYDDLILRARDLLSEGSTASWVLYKLDGGIDHILVDEAQDTNPEQWQVVTVLAEEFFAGEGARDQHRTIFAVGDAKQSIYGFQRADPEAFEQWRGHFRNRVREARLKFRNVELKVSFRSTEAVLNLVDQVFYNPAAADGLMFTGEPIDHDAHRNGHAGLVEMWPTEKPLDGGEGEDDWAAPVTQHSSDDPPARLAGRIADQIKYWLENKEMLEARGRPVRPGDIMILVRRRTAFVNQLVSAFKARGIPVSGADRMKLTQQIAVMDLIALGRFVLLPDDDLNLAIVLKGPLVGLDDDALFALARGRRSTLWRELRQRTGDGPRFEQAAAFLSNLLGRPGGLAPYEFFADLLTRRDGRRKLMARLGPEASDPIDEFLSLALEYQRLHPPSLEGFLHWVEAGEAEIKRDMEQGRDEVRIMTVHGAKGLQAPIVMLPDTCQVPRSRSHLLWIDDGTIPLPIWTLKKDNEVGIIGRARNARDVERMREYRRLLYVALTRAEDRLYISGWETSKGKDEVCWYDLIASALPDLPGLETVSGDGGPFLRFRTEQTAALKETAPRTESGAPSPDLPDWTTRPAPAEPRYPMALIPSKPGGTEPPARSPLTTGKYPPYRIGTITHRLLQSLPGLERDQREDAARRLLGQRGHGLKPGDIDRIISGALGVLNAPDFAPVFAPGSRAEVPVIGVADGLPVSGQVDRLAVMDREVLVVDFKTNRMPPRNVDEIPPVYLRQMAAYWAILRQIYPDKEIRCALLWTDQPQLMILPENALVRGWAEMIAMATA
ncbi:MAG: double-strand break repair helicase AddA [Sphingomonadales bacterium]